MNLTGINDLDFKILNDLDDKDLVSYCRVNRSAKEMCNDQTFWLQRIMKKYPYIPSDLLRRSKNRRRTWSQYYIEDLKAITPETAYHYLVSAATSGRLDLVMIAIQMGANPNPDQDQQTFEFPLNLAAQRGHLDIVKYLVEHGADISMEGNISLMNAVVKDRVSVVDYMLSLDVGKSQIYKPVIDRALLFAVSYKTNKINIEDRLKIVKILVEHDADISEGILRSARRNGIDEITSYLVEHAT